MIRTKATAERLMRVLSRDELASLAEAMNLPPTASTEEVAGSMSELPRYEIVRATLRAANPTLLLLRDIFDSLEFFGISVRTTGCVFVLADPVSSQTKSELEFSPQAVGTISNWQPEQDWKPLTESLDSLKATWRRFHHVWMQLLSDASPSYLEGDIDVVSSVIESRLVREPDTEEVDEDAQKVLALFVSKLTAVTDKLSAIPRDSTPPELNWILQDIRQLLSQAKKILPERKVPSRRRTVSEKPPSENIIRRYVTHRFTLDFDKFLEDVYALSSLTEGERFFDILRLDIWSSRPQLYEVWALLTILRWLARRGYRVKTLRASGGQAAVFRWDLAYAKDSEPCAVVSAPSEHSLYAFYQLYRPSGNMPDLCLLTGPDADSKPVWSVDLKHSEKGGYSIRDYRLTAERYRDSFGAPVSIVAEYFLRRECAGENPKRFGPGALLVHDCRLDGAGLEALFQELSDCHPTISSTLVCIDLSVSFSSNLSAALSRFRKEVNTNVPGETYLDEFVCFAGSAKIMRGLSSWLSGSQEDIHEMELTPGTAWEPLFRTITEVVRDTPVTSIVLITDGGFDVPLDSAMRGLEEKLKVNVRVFS